MQHTRPASWETVLDRRQLAALVADDLDDILQETRAAYLERVPRLRRLPREAVDASLIATRRTMEQFLRYYVEGTLDSASWQSVRDATIDRAGELFSHAEILEIINIGRSTATDYVHRLADQHPELTDAERNRVTAAIDRYIEELAEQEDRLRQFVHPDNIESVLADLEAEGADLQ